MDAFPGSLAIFDKGTNLVDSAQCSADLDFFASQSALSTPTFMTFPDASPAGSVEGWTSESDTASTQSRRASRRISNGILDKVAKFEALGSGLDVPFRRPCTPSSQTGIASSPQTPVLTPVKVEATYSQPPNRFSADYDESMEETLKPVKSNRSNNRNSGIFQDLRQQAEAMAQTPPRANSIPVAINQVPGTPEFMNMRNISAEFKKIERAFDMSNGPLEMPAMILPNVGQPGALGNKPSLQPSVKFDSGEPNAIGARPPSSATPSRRSSPHRRTQSVASMTSAASIADINIEETRTETGVTLEDIAAFIQGPDPETGKWVCLYENCNKPFGRKENIKSHVQTHLNDRQYRCPTCKKCFVRQHDLKRHAKIHTGIKPYPCQCGQSFARHDALTRHRQRGMCIGAYDGIVRKVAKRGRPKKIRPDMEERREKAERTRRKNKLTSACSASSQSGYSDSSAANSPHNDFDGLLDEDPFPGIAETAMLSLASSPPITMNPTDLSVSSAPMSSTTTIAEAFTALSPSAMSDYSHPSHTSASHLSLVNSPAPSHATLSFHLPSPAQHEHQQQQQQQPPQQQQQQQQEYHHPRHPQPRASPPTTSTSTINTTRLSSTSSPPPTGSSARFFELEGAEAETEQHAHARVPDEDRLEPGNSSVLSDASSIGLGTTVAARAAADALPALPAEQEQLLLLGGGGGGGGGGDDEEELFLQFAESGLVSLDHASFVLGGGKFEKAAGGGGWGLV
ncbi:c3eab147-e774-4bce-9379-2d51f8b6f3ce [Thermothielavioides terrestris]|uniref:C3eab147-e774-4bce-9379-2d51f8b6f3ce n=1 Tax=Thermothielavioides terrestris TaxID=2587410 RepID=A0A446BPN5_9PEZI|nr:c3eab147-e774-4bce-9379-2d51f8b6f3ce [Thermothielavioides terrestris]